MKTKLNIALVCCFVAALGLLMPACQKDSPTAIDAQYVGVYPLISVDGKAVPANLAHDGVTMQILSGAFTINSDGTCRSKMTVVPQGGAAVTTDVSGTFTYHGSTLTISWNGAGVTYGNLDGDTFTMNNAGMVLVYKKQV